ncbi:MAG: hypothetical protein M1835_008138 [Candelina submexicana]|nr:MAG: hypothetical protein M1835_008138 [Candelina submexicana]
MAREEIWGRQFQNMYGLRELQIEFETLENRKQVARARGEDIDGGRNLGRLKEVDELEREETEGNAATPELGDVRR